MVWQNDDGQEVDVMGELNDAAISDIMKAVEIADGDEEYEPGMILDFRELRP